MSVMTVNLGAGSYDILIASGSLSALGNECAIRGLSGNVALITNPTVAALYADVVRASLAEAGNSVTLIEIPDGEKYKNAETLNQVYEQLIEAGIDRHSFVVALGGGVVGDLAGFAAATYLRGIPFVQVPTTLLAQVDSSVGGKTAIDHRRGKNLIGAFYQPRLVLIDVNTLETLASREFHAGLAEVTKYGVVMDRAFFEFLEQNRGRIMGMDRECLVQVIRRCCELKARVVELDERESGLRAVLNYGHTLGHAFETVAGYSELVHGEAIAVGMRLAAHVSMQLGYCNNDDVRRIETLLSSFALSLSPPAVDHVLFRAALMTDKKNRSGVINFICNRGIGDHVIERLASEQLLTLSGVEV